jgi:hypothetical protein
MRSADRGSVMIGGSWVTLWAVNDAEQICSAKGCRAPAAWALRWNNPKLHPPERRKTWLACAQHRDHLASFLDLRGFLREVAPLRDSAA